MSDRGFYGLSPAQIKTIADELSEAVEAMSDDDPECLLDVEFKDYVEGDQGMMEGPLLCVSISEYPEEGVYPIDNTGNEQARKTRSREASAVPEECRLVPVEPTEEMQAAYFRAVDRNMPMVETHPFFGRHDNHRIAYRAMLDAAPKLPWPAADGLQKLAEFGRRCFDDAVAEGGDIEWDKAFEDAQEVGLLEPEHRNEPCAEIEQCRCSEAGVDFPTTCYRVPDRLMPLLREQRTQCQPQEVE